ncbi:hypothetical protein [Clostridium beijerinckii]|nr:hypothetical protein [Clostridium beijerinckii]NRT48617.1 hypothetical protein [Clostridium beijerinckii]NRU36594.1 hypothetical protein [Clostridium beijerinckii]NRZ23086.1 hypothetical protein [Clostridium beijerinckii]NSB00127.1 hypothetical protein [Clostridium beijerinckii]
MVCYMIYGEMMHTHKEKGALDLPSQNRDKVYWKVMAGLQCTCLLASPF